MVQIELTYDIIPFTSRDKIGENAHGDPIYAQREHAYMVFPQAEHLEHDFKSNMPEAITQYPCIEYTHRWGWDKREYTPSNTDKAVSVDEYIHPLIQGATEAENTVIAIDKIPVRKGTRNTRVWKLGGRVLKDGTVQEPYPRFPTQHSIVEAVIPPIQYTHDDGTVAEPHAQLQYESGWVPVDLELAKKLYAQGLNPHASGAVVEPMKAHITRTLGLEWLFTRNHHVRNGIRREEPRPARVKKPAPEKQAERARIAAIKEEAALVKVLAKMTRAEMKRGRSHRELGETPT